MLALLQDALSPHQNWTVLGILGAVLLTLIGLLVWVVKWLCGRFTASIDKCSEVVDRNTTTTTQLALQLEAMRSDNAGAHQRLADGLEAAPQRTADELQRRKLG